MQQTWSKQTWVCSGCDALIEFTLRDDFPWPNGIISFKCPCGHNCTLLSVADATINNNNEQKEDSPMNTTHTFLEEQVNELKAQLANHQNCDYWKAENGRVQSQIIDIIDEIYAGNWTDETDIANSLCQVIDYTPTKEIEFTATMNFTGKIQVPANEDFDLEEILSDAYVDINHGDVVIDSYELYDANEC